MTSGMYQACCDTWHLYIAALTRIHLPAAAVKRTNSTARARPLQHTATVFSNRVLLTNAGGAAVPRRQGISAPADGAGGQVSALVPG